MEPKLSIKRHQWLAVGLMVMLISGQVMVRQTEATALLILTGACTIALDVALREAGPVLAGLESQLEAIRNLCEDIFLRMPEEVVLRQLRDLIEFIAEGNLNRPDRAQQLVQLVRQLAAEVTNGGGK